MMPRSLVGVVCCILACTSVAFAQPQPLPEALSDPQFLSSRSWKGDKGLEAVVRNWPAYTEKQGFDDKTVLNRAEVTVLGSTFEAEYRVFKTDSLAEIVLLGDEPGDFCPTFLAWATKRLGSANKVIDLSNLGQQDAWASVTADWLFGQTRVQLSCAGAKLYSKWIRPGLVVLMYRHKDQLKALEDLIYIECSATRKVVGRLADGRTEEAEPLTLIIDPNNRRVIRSDKSAFLKTDNYTDDEILASYEEKSAKGEFRLNRVTGHYRWNVRMKEDSRNGVDQWGKCSRADPSRKF